MRFISGGATSEFIKRWNPKPGDIVAFKHRGFLLATKKPKFATIYRLRDDLVWDDVVQNWKEKKSTSLQGKLLIHVYLRPVYFDKPPSNF